MARITGCGAISRLAIWVTSWPRSTGACTELTRITRRNPPPASASDGLSGDEAFLVVRYEYTPGFDKLDAVAVGGQGHYWLNDYVRLGLTANSNEGNSASNLGAADLTLRKSANSWFKLQAGRSTGLLSPSLQSNDGGFGFHGP